MATFKCSCGEVLMPPKEGILRCWFCDVEYIFPEGTALNLSYESQQSRPVIKTLDVHTMGTVKTKKVCPFDI